MLLIYDRKVLQYFHDSKKDRWKVRQLVDWFEINIINGDISDIGDNISDICRCYKDLVGVPQQLSAPYLTQPPDKFTGMSPNAQNKEVTFRSFEMTPFISDNKDFSSDQIQIWGTRDILDFELKALKKWLGKKETASRNSRKKQYEELKAEFESKKVKPKDKPLKKIKAK